MDGVKPSSLLRDRFERMMGDRLVPAPVRAALLEAFMAGAAAHDRIITDTIQNGGDSAEVAKALDDAVGEMRQAKHELDEMVKPAPVAPKHGSTVDNMVVVPVETSMTNAVRPHGHGGNKPLPVVRQPGITTTHWIISRKAMRAMGKSPHVLSLVVGDDGTQSMRVMPIQTVRGQ